MTQTNPVFDQWPQSATRMAITGCAMIAMLIGVPVSPAGEVDRNAAFRQHLSAYQDSAPLAVARIEANWQAQPAGAQLAFIPDSLAILSAPYAEALSAFERTDYAAALAGFKALSDDGDPYLAANASYFQLRVLVALERYEQAEALLTIKLADVESLERYTPYGPHLMMLLAHCQARNLRALDALDTLKQLLTSDQDLAEAVLVAARQLTLELERQGDAPLDEVERLMRYVAARLEAIDTSERTRLRQDKIIELLDQMIEEAENQEQQGQSGGSSSSEQAPQPQQGSQGAQRSEQRSGDGQIGELHDSPPANPGEAWGDLPPAERERILQDLRERFPTRYRQLVEQYYRSLAEEE
jgi:tetratricopeptide (TPR) repeat protein